MTAKILFALSLGLAVMVTPLFVFAQKNAPQTQQPAQELMKRVVVKADKMPFGAGGTVTILGAPRGSVTVVGSNKSEIEVSAEIELQAPTEAELAALAQVNGIIVDPSTIHVRILSVGMHDKDYMKKNWKKFPKNLLNMPWKIDYVVHVPMYTDIDVTVGKGDLKVSGVEGAMLLKGTDTNADLTLTGGTVMASFGSGSVNVNVTSNSWRGRNMNVQLASGTMNVVLPPAFNADIDASVLRNGEIKNSYELLKPRQSGSAFTPKNVAARSGNGGAVLSFILGDGNMTIADKPADNDD